MELDGLTLPAPRRIADIRVTTAVATELQLLTGLPITQCRERVALASATDERAGYLRARVASALETQDAA